MVFTKSGEWVASSKTPSRTLRAQVRHHGVGLPLLHLLGFEAVHECDRERVPLRCALIEFELHDQNGGSGSRPVPGAPVPVALRRRRDRHGFDD